MSITEKNKHMLYGAIGMLQSLKLENIISDIDVNDFLKNIHSSDQKINNFIKLFVDINHIENNVIKPMKEECAYEQPSKRRGRKPIESKTMFENVPEKCSLSSFIQNEEKMSLQYIYSH